MEIFIQFDKLNVARCVVNGAMTAHLAEQVRQQQETLAEGEINPPLYLNKHRPREREHTHSYVCIDGPARGHGLPVNFG